MSLTANLTMRLGAIMLVGFVLLQLAIVAVLGLPDGGEADRPFSLPPPAQLAAIVTAVEQRPPAARPAMIRAFDAGMYSVSLAGGPPAPRQYAMSGRLPKLADSYRAVLPGRAVRVDSRGGRMSGWLDGGWFGDQVGPDLFLGLVRVTVPLTRGGWLVVEGRPSAGMRVYLRRRTVLRLVGGLVLVLILLVAVRQTTRPITRVAAGVRGFSAGGDTPDLPLEGPRDVRELAQAFNEMKGRIAGLMADRTRILAAIAHDLRTYLTRLRLRADYIDDAHQQARAIADLDEMALLIDDTLLFAAIDGRHGGPREPIDLLASVVRLVALRREMGQAVTFAAAIDEALPVLAPRLALDRIFGNLVDNALRHGSAAEVRLDRIDGHVRLTVGDDGPGAPPDQLARLAEPFHRLDPSRDRGSGGAGLGLAIVRALAQQMGGTLKFGTSALGGLEVEVMLPLA